MNPKAFVGAALVGLASAALRFVYSFFPWINVWDGIVFGLAGFLVAGSRIAPRWAAYLLTVLPGLCTIVLILDRLGWRRIEAGVGSAHVYGLIAVPVAAAVGFAWGVKKAARS